MLLCVHGGKPGDRRTGVVWHTQGNGKSFTMLFFVALVKDFITCQEGAVH